MSEEKTFTPGEKAWVVDDVGDRHPCVVEGRLGDGWVVKATLPFGNRTKDKRMRIGDRGVGKVLVKR